MQDPQRPEPQPALDAEIAGAARDLKAIASEARLLVLRSAAVPSTVAQVAGETRLPPKEAQAELDALVLAGLVRRQPGRISPSDPEYVVVANRVFGLSESIAKLTAGPEEDDLMQTRSVMKASRGATAMLKLAPALVQTHGMKPGAVYSLSGPGPWTLGRDPSCQVALDYDSFVSTRHADVVLRGKEHVLVDALSRNGTFVNWERLPRGGEMALTPGDVVGVGKSLLVYRRPRA